MLGIMCVLLLFFLHAVVYSTDVVCNAGAHLELCWYPLSLEYVVCFVSNRIYCVPLDHDRSS